MEYCIMIVELIMIVKLISMINDPEYDIDGIADHFLQIRLMCILRILGHGDVDASDFMNDVLAQFYDNAGGIAEMVVRSHHIRERIDALDAAGNTTSAIGKGVTGAYQYYRKDDVLYHKELICVVAK
ncbi:AP-1 complex subunit gamma-2-like protein, partial [Tanacetum coccineum]